MDFTTSRVQNYLIQVQQKIKNHLQNYTPDKLSLFKGFPQTGIAFDTEQAKDFKPLTTIYHARERNDFDSYREYLPDH